MFSELFIFYANIKGIVHPKIKILSFPMIQSFLPLNTKGDILKNVGNQTIDSYWLPMYVIFSQTMEVNGYRQLFGYQHSSKYLLFECSETNSNKLKKRYTNVHLKCFRNQTFNGWCGFVHVKNICFKLWKRYFRMFSECSKHVIRALREHANIIGMLFWMFAGRLVTFQK